MSALISVERLLLRLRQVPSRADELLDVRRRLRRERRARAGEAERTTAAAIRAIKTEVSAALASVDACRACASGKPWPRGAHAGGDCCSGVTADLFDDGEVAALALGGTRTRDLTAPRGDHAGCAFRGTEGCTLAAADRPGLCIYYMCSTLRHELHTRGELAAIDARLAELDRLTTQFLELRRDRLAQDELAPLARALGDTIRGS